MLSFRQFLECNDVDTSTTPTEDLGSLNWHYEPAYRMYCNASALEMQKDINHKAFIPQDMRSDSNSGDSNELV